MRTNYKTRAPFFLNGKWGWLRWTNTEPNKHAAIAEKAREIGAVSWDAGQADHVEADRANF